MALPKFPLPYLFDVEKTIQYATKSVKFYSQKKQIQILSPNPIREWRINVKGTPEQYKTLESFFKSMHGDAGTFIFIDEFGQEQTVRFTDNKLSPKLRRNFNTGSPTNGFVVGFEITISLEEAL